MRRLRNGCLRMHATGQHVSQAFTAQRSTSWQGDCFRFLTLHMLSRSQDACRTPPGLFAAGRPVPHQAPGPYDSPHSALGARFAAADTRLPYTLTPRPAATAQPLHDTLATRFATMEISLHNTLAPRFAATAQPLHDTLAPRFAAMEVSPHKATPGEEQAGEPALLAAGAYLHF